jgi:glycosyltransferase involved in cell wall biosynthesis
MNSQVFTFHVVSLPHTQTTKAHSACAYTEKVRNFCNMMSSLGHQVYLYASEENEAHVSELVTCIRKSEQLEGIPQFSAEEKQFKLMNQRVVAEMGSRIKPKDFICVIAGHIHKVIADNFPSNMTVEFGIGYEGVFSSYRVFESYAWMHTVYGYLYTAMGSDGRNYDAVIHGYVDPKDFPFQPNKEDYFLFAGRLIDRKGYGIAVDVCKRLGKRLIIAGSGSPPEYGEYVGVVGLERLGELMGRAQAVFVPTAYVGPMETVHIMALTTGTPVISTDWGVFTETIRNGFNGFRCRTISEFMAATEAVKALDYKAISEDAVKKYSINIIKYHYQDYFEQLMTLWGDGFYDTSDWRSGPPWLRG